MLNLRVIRVRCITVGRSTISAVAQCFWEHGEAGLIDQREANGKRKLDEAYLAKLHEVVAASVHDFGWRRPNWTREMLAETMTWEPGVRVDVSTMSTALRIISARLGRPQGNRTFKRLETLVKCL